LARPDERHGSVGGNNLDRSLAIHIQRDTHKAIL